MEREHLSVVSHDEHGEDTETPKTSSGRQPARLRPKCSPPSG